MQNRREREEVKDLVDDREVAQVSEYLVEIQTVAYDESILHQREDKFILLKDVDMRKTRSLIGDGEAHIVRLEAAGSTGPLLHEGSHPIQSE